MLVNEKIDKNNSVPYYYQLKLILEEYIKKVKDLTEPIPTEEYLSAHFSISRPTVRQAINELVVEGKLYRLKGKGTFVSKPKINQDFTMRIESFESEIRNKGMIPETRVIEFSKTIADEKIAAALGLKKGEPVWELWRLRYADAVPVVINITYLPYHKCSDFVPEDFINNSLYAMLESKYGYNVAWVSRSMEAILAGDYEASLLDINKGAPLQYFESIAYLEDNTPIEFSLAKYRGDTNKFCFKLIR